MTREGRPMRELSSEQIRIIKYDIEKSGIKNNLLKDELLDHLCCCIESEMEKGLTFNHAYRKTSEIYPKKELSKTQRNLSFFINYKSFLTTGLLYLSIITYIISWVVHVNAADWIGFVSFLLVSFVFLRYSVVFNISRNLKFHKLLSILSGTVFVLFLAGSVFRFLWLNYGLSNPHVMPMLIFSWLILVIISQLYYYELYKTYSRKSSKKRIKIFQFMGFVHFLLVAISMSTFFFPVLMQYIPELSGVIVAVNVIFFIYVIMIKQKGSGLIKSLLVSSFLIVFIYFPHKALVNSQSYSVQFQTITKNELDADNLYLHINYFKYGKETLMMERRNDSVFRTEPIQITGGNIDMACKITKKKKDTYEVLYNEDIRANKIQLHRNDTLFTLEYKP